MIDLDKKKVIKFEIAKILSNIKLIKTLIFIFIVIILLFVILFAFEQINTQEPQFSKEQILLMYESRLENINNELINTPEGNLKKNLINEKLKLEYFIKTNTTEYDYLKMTHIGDKIKNCLSTSFMFYMFNSTYVTIILLAIFLSIYTFAFDIENKYIKNICSSQITKKNIIIGKLLFHLLCFTLLFILYTMILFIIGLFNRNTNLLVFDGVRYYSMNALVSFLLQSIGLYFLCVVVSIITDYIIIIGKKTSVVILIILFIFVLLLLTSHILNKSINFASINFSTDYYVLLFNIPYIFKYINYYTLHWSLFYIGLISMLIYLTIRKFNKYKF